MDEKKNTDRPMDQKQLDDITLYVIKLVDQMITPDEFEKLNQAIASSPRAARHYNQLMLAFQTLQENAREVILDDALDIEPIDLEAWESLAAYERTAPAIEVPKVKPPRELIQKVVYPPRQKRKISKFDKFVLITTAAAALFIFAFVKIEPLLNPPRIEVATLADQADAQWAHLDAGQTLEAGSRLRSHEDPFRLNQGTARVRFDYGAEVVIEGPAEFELIDEEKMILNYGRLYASVGKGAVGFTAVTPSATIIDLGTEFGVEVGFDGSTDVHMFKGEASLVSGKSGSKERAIDLSAGKARSVNMQGQVQKIRLKERAFVRPTQHQWRVKAEAGSAYHRWLLHSNQLRQDPSLVAYYTFEKNQQRPQVLENKASLTKGKLNGDLYSAIDGKLPAWTEGRWPQKTALDFDRSERQVVTVSSDPALHINGPVTIAAWVKCDDPNDGGHIVSCRQPKGASNFQMGYKSSSDVFWKGKFSFLRGTPDEYPTEGSPDRIFGRQTFDASDQWKFIAATHDNHVLKFYVDGRLVETRQFESYPDPVVGDLVIGADNVAGDQSRFTGEMDELMIFSRVLSGPEIEKMFNSGKPD